MSNNNYGWRSNNMAKAAKFALNDAQRQGFVSYSTAATHAARFAQFAQAVRAEGVNRMEKITPDHVQRWGRELAKTMAPATAQNYVSSVNSVMKIASRGEWKSVSPTKECGIPERCHLRQNAPGTTDRGHFNSAVNSLKSSLSDRQIAVIELARNLGLRTKEASLFDAKQALKEAEKTGQIQIKNGTKGGLARSLSVTDLQIQTIRSAAKVQADARAIMPPNQNWREWRESGLREAREAMKAETGDNLRDLRSAYACERYEQITGQAAPCSGVPIADKKLDAEARMTIANELGHGRIDVVSEYIGGR